ncbi:MAG: DUF1175 family protein [Blastocatellia bacterium]
MKIRCALFICGLVISAALLAGCGRMSRALNVESAENAPVTRHAAAAGTDSPLADSDQDGFPDGAELRSFDDRSSFRRWMAAIAEMQFYKVSDDWNPAQRDCAGLVRFAMREALRPHDRAWFQRMGGEYEAIAPDVRAYQLDNGPLGEKLFRLDYSVFRPDDFEYGKFSEFADARTLKNFNAEFISRDRRRALAGDLIFFHQPWSQKFPYHVMVFIGEANIKHQAAGDWVVYHTGSSPEDSGVIKKARLATLEKHPDRRWRPVESNPNYLGVYRLKILE